MTADPGDPAGTWIVVDHDRIRRLPSALLALWPAEMRPEPPTVSGLGMTDPRATASATGGVGPEDIDPADPGARALAAAGLGIAPIPPPPAKRSTLDILGAWLRGFAEELALTHLRMSIVISSGHETVHLELALDDTSCWAVLALRGPEFAAAGDRQFLRRLGAAELAVIVDGLARIVEDDCVLTLSALDRDGRSRLELLSRTSGTWTGPVLERSVRGVTVVAHADRGRTAVRLLVAGVLTGLLPGHRPSVVP